MKSLKILRYFSLKNKRILRSLFLKALKLHCVKSVQIRSFFCSVFSRISYPNTGKYGLQKTPCLDTFHTILSWTDFLFYPRREMQLHNNHKKGKPNIPQLLFIYCENIVAMWQEWHYLCLHILQVIDSAQW